MLALGSSQVSKEIRRLFGSPRTYTEQALCLVGINGNKVENIFRKNESKHFVLKQSEFRKRILFSARFIWYNSELKQVTFLTTRTA
jgi:hypothetical protein